jgi:hypothetical protein
MSPTSQLVRVAEAISKLKAILIGNGMDKVLIESLKLFEKLPENERTADHLKELLSMGIEKTFEEKKIILKLRS